MERLTVPDVRVDEHTTRRSIIDGNAVREHAMEIYWRLKDYEDTGYTPEEIEKLQGDLIQRNAELLKTREELKKHYDSISQLDGANSSLMAANEKLAADRKALINELCQYCGKYKQAHEGACDGCKWREM
nr:MAG TPA: optinuerin [Caudoviricetes sp.]